MKTQYNAVIELFDYRNSDTLTYGQLLNTFYDWLKDCPMAEARDKHKTAEEYFDYLDSRITAMLDYDGELDPTVGEPYGEKEFLRDLKKETTFVELKYNQEFLSIVYIIIDSIYDRDKDFELFEGVEELMTTAKDKDKEPVAS